jgi:MYXO-CTERM domain-containing protein
LAVLIADPDGVAPPSSLDVPLDCGTDCTVPSISAPTTPSHGCSCGVSEGAGSSAAALLFVGLALLVTKRRRQRLRPAA